MKYPNTERPGGGRGGEQRLGIMKGVSGGHSHSFMLFPWVLLLVTREKRPVSPAFDKALDHNEAAYQPSVNQACTTGSGWPFQLPGQLCSDKR